MSVLILACSSCSMLWRHGGATSAAALYREVDAHEEAMPGHHVGAFTPREYDEYLWHVRFGKYLERRLAETTTYPYELPPFVFRH